MTHPTADDRQPGHAQMTRSTLHQLISAADQLQQVPTPYALFSLGINVALTVVFWQQYGLPIALLVAAGYAVTVAADWGLLRGLRQTGRSFGPDKPPALALAGVKLLVVVALGGLGVAWWLALLILLGITALAFYATWIEPFNVRLTRETYTTPRWQTGTPPLRLLHIGDLHIERITPREKRLNEIIAELKPDLIVFSGDFVNLSYSNDPAAEQAIRQIVGEWRAPLGIYCVPGTPIVEPLERVAAFVKDLDDVHLLTNRWVTVATPGGALHILGLITTHDLKTDRDALQKMMPSAPADGLKLLLTHSPDIAPEADATGAIDLYLCGHTHGGQIVLPLVGALFSSSQLGKRFIRGRYNLAHTTVYTTRGLGMEGLGAPRARFLSAPEIILWEISGSVSR